MVSKNYPPLLVSLPPGAVARPEAFDYSVGRVPGGRGGITSASAPRPEPFNWGKVLRVHVIGDDYAIVEYTPSRASNVSIEDYDPSPDFSVFVRGARSNSWDTGHSWNSLDAALIHAVAWRNEQRQYGINAAANSRAVMYISRMLGVE